MSSSEYSYDQQSVIEISFEFFDINSKIDMVSMFTKENIQSFIVKIITDAYGYLNSCEMNISIKHIDTDAYKVYIKVPASTIMKVWSSFVFVNRYMSVSVRLRLKVIEVVDSNGDEVVASKTDSGS